MCVCVCVCGVGVGVMERGGGRLLAAGSLAWYHWPGITGLAALAWQALLWRGAGDDGGHRGRGHVARRGRGQGWRAARGERREG